MEDNKDYKYDAFISYRHCELDKFVAVKLHRMLETYKIPNSLKKKLGLKRRSFKRVFRDQEELPLTSNLEDPIVEALNNSKYLIVICSPRLKESLWCKKEIETFKKIRGRKNVFCVLIEGEPSDSFPEEVLYDDKEITVNGKTKTERIMVEPLAADVRGKNKKQVLKKLKEEKLRLIAPMYNLDYDDLRQRHKIWRQKKIINTVLIVAILSVLFAIYSIAMFIKIEMQQNVLAKHHALSLVDEANESLAKDDRYEAVNISYQALTNFEDIVMPYTPNAEYTLVESLGVYDVGASYKAVNSLKTDGIISAIKSSSDYKYAAVYDGSEKITLFDAQTLDIIKEIKIDDHFVDEESFDFIGNDILAYINKDGDINLVSVKDGKEIKTIKKVDYSYIALKGDYNNKYLVYVDSNNLYIYDTSSFKVVASFTSDEKYDDKIFISKDDKYIFTATIKKMDEYDVESAEYMTIHVIDTASNEEINKVTFEAGYFEGIALRDNNVFILMNNLNGVNFDLIIASYDYINNNINWQKESEGHWGQFINRTHLEDTNYIAIASSNVINVLDGDTGDLVESFNTTSEIINMYAYLDSDMFLVFSSNGYVNTINMNNKINMYIPGRYEFNAGSYSYVTLSENGFILIPENDTRVILYEKKKNNYIKKLDVELDFPKDDSISLNDYDKIKNDYNLNNKSLVSKIFFDNKKETLFINYKNGDIVIYDTKTKKELNSLKEISQVNHYFGKDKYGRTYIGNISDAYILDSNYDLVGHIKGLVKLDKDKVIIVDSNSNYYEVKIYTLDDLKKEAKKYLKENKK